MNGKMKTAVMLGIGKMGFEERDIPKAKDNEVLVKLEYVGICGSDLHYYETGAIGNYVVEPPFVLGHEPGGTVVEVGKNVKHLKAGDRVALEPGKTCGHCEFCKTGRYNLCPDVVFFATPPVDGVFQEYVAHEADLCFKLPDNVSTMEGALIEPLAVGFHAAMQGGARAGQTAVVMGAGCIGLVTMMALKAMGVSKVYVVDIMEKRLEKAMELGADGIINGSLVFRLTNNKGRSAAIFALLTGISMFCMYFFTVSESPVPFYLFSCLAQFFFSGFNTAIYAIVPDCVEYGEWKTGLRNDGFQYAFISLGNKIGMAIGTSALAGILGAFGYAANQQQNPAVLAVIRHSFTTVPGILWIVTAAVLYFYRLNKKAYNEIVKEIQERKGNGKHV